jgi:hypothetical protein
VAQHFLVVFHQAAAVLEVQALALVVQEHWVAQAAVAVAVVLLMD